MGASFLFRLNGPPWTGVIDQAAIAGQDWQQFFIPFESTGGFPACRALARSEAFVNASSGVNRAFLDKAADLVTFWPLSANWAEINSALIGPRMDVLLREGGDVAPALRELTAPVNAKLAGK